MVSSSTAGLSFATYGEDDPSPGTEAKLPEPLVDLNSISHIIHNCTRRTNHSQRSKDGGTLPRSRGRGNKVRTTALADQSRRWVDQGLRDDDGLPST